MSITTFHEDFTARLRFNTPRDLATAVLDWLTNNPDEMPEDLGFFDDSEEVVAELMRYITVVDKPDPGGPNFTISYDTEDGPSDVQVFEALATFCAVNHTGSHLRVGGSSYDSRGGTSSWARYYDKQGRLIDVDAALTTYLTTAAI
jgi:hypothetical protein